MGYVACVVSLYLYVLTIGERLELVEDEDYKQLGTVVSSPSTAGAATRRYSPGIWRPPSCYSNTFMTS